MTATAILSHLTSWLQSNVNSGSPVRFDPQQSVNSQDVLKALAELPNYPRQYKIQTGSVNGWGDVKSSTDGGPYELDVYNTWEEAQAEIDSCQPGEFNEDYEPSDYRIVPLHVEQQDDLYDED
jgi:hypothetical protein